MNISNQERQALFNSKLLEGKDEQTAKLEIYRDTKFIKDFNQVKRDAENELKQLSKEKDRLLTQIEKSRQTLLKLDKEASQPRPKPKESLTWVEQSNGVNSNKANTVILTRVLHFIENLSISNSDIKSIAQDCCISKSQAEDAINFINKWVRQ